MSNGVPQGHGTYTFASGDKYVGEIWNDSPHGHGTHPIVRIATKLQILTMVRPGELRFSPWSEFDFKKRLWTIPAERMKSSRERIVPLSNQVIELLTELRKITGEYRLLFPKISTKWGGPEFDGSKTISENTLSQAIKRMGYSSDPHGFRRTGITYLHNAEHNPTGKNGAKQSLFDSIWVEFSLAHEGPDKVRGAYYSGRYLTQRTRMLEYWADQVMRR